MQHDVKIDHDLENSPLQIKTDSVLGSDHEVVLRFYTVEEDVAGDFSIRFTSRPTYRFLYCMNEHTNFPTALPSVGITPVIFRLKVYYQVTGNTQKS